MEFATLNWNGGIDGSLVLIDQRELPNQLSHIECEKIEDVFIAIKTLAVRGAPAIGVSAAYGLCVHMQSLSTDADLEKAIEHLKSGAVYLATSRPTAVNLFWALERMQKVAADFVSQNSGASVPQLQNRLLQEATAIDNEDKLMCEKIGDNGLQFVKPGSRILTHCNAGALATAGVGTALAPMYAAKKAGVDFKVYVDETRPLLQGARLTAWELTQNNIDATLICDNMAGWLMKNGMVDMVIVGADRITANGDAANKIGTYSLSVLAKHHGVAFYVAAPSSTFDLSLDSGDQIPIEERQAEEICEFGKKRTAPEDMKVFNPAFDVTPAENIAAIITEKGVIESPSRELVLKVIQ